MENTAPETKKTASYIDRVRLFWKIDAESPFTGGETRLYFFLLEEINRNMWKPVRLSVRKIMERVNASNWLVRKSLEILHQKELIEVRRDNALHSKGYLISLPESVAITDTPIAPTVAITNTQCSNNQYSSVAITDTPIAPTVAITDTQCSNNRYSSVAITDTPFIYSIKTYKDVLEDNNNIAHTRGTGDVVGVDSVPRNGIGNNEFFTRYFAPENNGTVEMYCAENYIQLADFKRYARQVYTEWEATGQKHTDYSEAARHLLNHIRVKIAADRKAASAGPRETREQADERLKRKAARDIIEAIRNPYDNDNNDNKPF